MAPLMVAAPAYAVTMDDVRTAIAEKRPFDAFQYLKELAEAGNPEAQYELGGFYHWGRVGAADFTKARQWYERAAKQGNVDAMLGLAVIYGHGQGVPQDKAASFRWLVLASTQQLAPEDAARIAAARDDLATASDRPADRGGPRRGPQLHPQAGIAGVDRAAHRGGRRPGAPGDRVQPADLLAPALAARRRRDLGQAREPPADRRLQGARRPHLHPPPAPRPAERPGRHRRHPRQPRPEHRLRRAPVRPALRGGRAARQQPVQERRHARLWRGADRDRPRFPGHLRGDPGDRRGAQAAFRALVPPLAAGRGCDLRLGTDAGGPGPGDDLCADRARLRHLLHHPGARRPWAPDRDRRRGRGQRRRLRPVVRRQAAGLDQQRRHHRRWRGLPGPGRGCVASDLARCGARDPGQRG